MRGPAARLLAAIIAVPPPLWAGAHRVAAPARGPSSAPLGGLALGEAIAPLPEPAAFSAPMELAPAQPLAVAAEAPTLAVEGVPPSAEEAPLPAAMASLEALAQGLEDAGPEAAPRAAALEIRVDGRSPGSGGPEAVSLVPAVAVLGMSATEPALVAGLAVAALGAAYLWMRFGGPGGAAPKMQRLAIRRDGRVVPAPEEPRPSLSEAAEALWDRFISALDALRRRARRLLAWRPWRGKPPSPPPSVGDGSA